MRFWIIILSLILPLTGFSQTQKNILSIKSFDLINSVAYLPSVYSESESYRYNSGRLKHRYSKTKVLWRFRWNANKLIALSNKEQVLKSVIYYTQNIKNDFFLIDVSQQDKDSLIVMSKRKDYRGNPLYYADYSDLIKYINNKDTINIDIKEFNTDYSKTMDALTSVIDGTPFWITLKLKYNNNDSVKYEYVGNLCDGVEDTNVDEFLIFYNIYKDNSLFKYTPMDKYFAKENLYKVILRYIAYKENKFDRKNYFKFENK